MENMCCICGKVFSIEENSEFWSIEEDGDPILYMCPKCSKQDGAKEYMLDELKKVPLNQWWQDRF